MRSENERHRLRRENERLREELEMARRRANRQAAPFSRGRPKAHPDAARPQGGRRVRPEGASPAAAARGCDPRGAAARALSRLRRSRCGAAASSRSIKKSCPCSAPSCTNFVSRSASAGSVIAAVQGRHPLQTSDALGAAAVQLGPQAVALAVILNKQCGLSSGRIATLLHDRFGLTVTRGGLVHAVRRAARQAQPTYAALCAQVRAVPSVTPDETGWKVGGHLYWLWAFATPDTTTYAIEDGRGFAKRRGCWGPTMPASSSGMAGRRTPIRPRRASDGLAHLLRRCRTLRLDYPHHRWAPQVDALLRAALATRDRQAAGAISAHGLAVARGAYRQRLGRLLARRPSRLADVRRFAKHLTAEADAVFRFLLDPTLDATNWRADMRCARPW